MPLRLALFRLLLRHRPRRLFLLLLALRALFFLLDLVVEHTAHHAVSALVHRPRQHGALDVAWLLLIGCSRPRVTCPALVLSLLGGQLLDLLFDELLLGMFFLLETLRLLIERFYELRRLLAVLARASLLRSAPNGRHYRAVARFAPKICFQLLVLQLRVQQGDLVLLKYPDALALLFFLRFAALCQRFLLLPSGASA